MSTKRRTIGGGALKAGFGYTAFGGHDEFKELIDVPSSYVGQGGKVVVVKGTEDGLEFNTEQAIDRHDVLASAGDPTPNFLDSKIGTGAGLTTQVLTSPFPPNAKTLEIDLVIELDNLDFSGATLRVRPFNVNDFFNPTTGLPLLPADKDKYISLATANGWTIHREYQYDLASLTWLEFVPTKGLTRYNIATDRFWYFNGTIWIAMIGTGANQSCAGNDGRLSDARTPLAHVHAPADVTGTAVITSDPRLSDSRTPTAHAFGGALHSQDTIANVQGRLSSGKFITTDSAEISTITEKTALVGNDLLVIEDSADSNNKKRVKISNTLGNIVVKEKTYINSSGITVAVNIIMFRATTAMTLTKMYVYRVGGTGATVNARKNGASNHCSSAFSISSADTWMDSGASQNLTYASGDKCEIMVVTTAGSPTQLAFSLEFNRV
jgi:hypothetical protein